MIEVIKVGSAAIAEIRSLAHVTWPAAYKDILSPQQREYMLELIYSETSLHRQIEQEGHQFILAVTGKENAGFADYSVKYKNAPSTYHLNKIYVHPGWQGKGIGKLLLDYVLEDISRLNATQLQLNVNRKNKALHFYEKLGFKIIREEDIDIGSGYFMNDYVMGLML